MTSPQEQREAGQVSGEAITEFGIKSDMSGWLRVVVTVERSRSRWDVVKTAYTTKPLQWGEGRSSAGSLHSRVVLARGAPTRRAAINQAERTTL